ncbi:hypothetical protein A11A3_13865 [Alcanivorax hongdengensis A-11-3]|uniref:YcxB-like protein domain-containing protein n=1 Tax=Alcanivorax hongdengensis A-11-3 TaxID=1177179 RepID=L0W901_9GAMM|nr:hypothetical protein [Alcanivorax hongdengensis]EKF73444.1 hypothetical protein A11A3_13865 [Alcanivorax hongdengensis A-11-3]
MNMKLKYLSTLEEAVETQILWLRDLNTVAKWRLWGAFYWALVAALVYAFATGPTINKLAIGLVLGSFLGGNLVFNAEGALRKKLKKIILKKSGEFEPSQVTVILSDSSIEYSARGITLEFDRSKLTSVVSSEIGLVATFNDGNLLYIPELALSNEDDKEGWFVAIKAR